MVFSVIQLQKLKDIISFKKLLCTVTIKPGKRWSSKYFLTTPIFYVNAEPHIGHLYTAVIGDASNRFKKLQNPDLETKFMVGTDEHGLKISQAASAQKMEVKTFCDQVSNRYKEMFKLFNIQYDDFVRTTEDRHVTAVTALWNKIFSKNLIYSEAYSGWYSIADEMFVSELYLDPNIGSNGERYTLEGHKQVFFQEEVNYKFKLSGFKKDLLYWLKDEIIRPKYFQSQCVKLIEEEAISDISVSRPINRVTWGIPVPGDPSQSIYVWFDALSSYLCSNGYPGSNFKWPPDIQVIGKDILRFHAIFWPSFLMAADLEPPRGIICHSHWLKDDEKMSKSKGNIVDPFQSCDQFTSEGLRYFLLRGGVLHSDGSFSDTIVKTNLNAELSDTLGNLLNRCTSKSINSNQIFPALFEDYEKYSDETCDNLIKALENLPESVTNHFNDFNFYKGIDDIMGFLHTLNRFFQSRSPWDKQKSENHKILTLHLTIEGLRCCGILLQPIIPKISSLLLDKLSIPVSKRNLRDIRPHPWEVFGRDKSEDMTLMTGNLKLFPKLVTA